jgi:hypothetical protein
MVYATASESQEIKDCMDVWLVVNTKEEKAPLCLCNKYQKGLKIPLRLRRKMEGKLT